MKKPDRDARIDDYNTSGPSLRRLAIALFLAIVALTLYGLRPFDPNQVSGKPVLLTRENWNGRPFTAWTVPQIQQMISDYVKAPLTAEGACQPLTILWLGNSQLHTIKEYRPGDHASPFWLRSALPCPDTMVPLGVSLPNVSLQELYLSEEYVTARLPVRLILVELSFDGSQRDGLRQEFAGFPEQSDRAVISTEPIGRDMLEAADARWDSHNALQQRLALAGSLQQPLDNFLARQLEIAWPLWNRRDQLNGRFIVDLYLARNYLLGITPSTTRKLIRPFYDRNMRALEAMLRLARQRRIPVVAYIAPLRQDVTAPYDPTEYAEWIRTLTELLPKFGATLLDFESLVPSEDWGDAYENPRIVDIVHFANPGHQKLAQALLAHARAAGD